MLKGKDLERAIASKPFSAVPRAISPTDRLREVYLDSPGNGHCIVIMPQAMSDVMQIENCARACGKLEGDIAEAGVYFGATARLLMRFFDGRKTIHLFDTFDVMPDADPEHDLPEWWDPKKDLSVAKVKMLLEDFDKEGLVKFYKGLFKDTLHEAKDKRFCFVHVDCDLYQGAKDCCEFFYPRLVEGGIMMFHDYDVPAFPGIREAVEEYFLYKPALRVTNRYGSHHVVVKR